MKDDLRTIALAAAVAIVIQVIKHYGFHWYIIQWIEDFKRWVKRNISKY